VSDHEVLADGYQLVEAPRVADDGSVWFSDALGGGVYRWSPGGAVETVLAKRRGVGGMALHASGGMVVSGRDVRHIRPGQDDLVLLAQPEGVTGFNDICATSDGRILAGGLRFMPFSGGDPVPSAFWHVTAAGVAAIVLEDVLWPNGVGDDDNGTFWFCDYARGVVHRIGGDPPVSSTELPGGEADGLAFDDEGCAWIAQPRHGRLHARHLESDTLYVTTIASESTSGALLRMTAPVPGRRHHLATI